jgi:HlyD family secretion protein
MKHKTKFVVLALATGIGAAALVANRFREASKPALATVSVARGDIHRSVIAAGKIEPRVRVQIKSKASGLVRSVYVREGDYVRKGQLLLDIDREYLASKWKGAKAALSVAEALEREANADVTSARANLDKSRSEASVKEHELAYTENEFARKKALFEQKLISRAEVESWNKQLSQNRDTLQALASGVVSAEAQLRRAELGVGRAKAAITQAMAEAEVTEEELDNASIRSPIDGVVLTRRVEVGDAVSSITLQGSMAPLLMELGDTSQLFVKAFVNESDIAHIRLRQPALLTVESFRDHPIRGTVARIAPLGNEKDNVTNFEVEISIDDSNAPIRPSMSVTAEVILESRKQVLLLPERAIRYDEQGQATVEIPAPGLPSGVTVAKLQLGITDGIRAEVRRGLQEGQQVIERR